VLVRQLWVLVKQLWSLVRQLVLVRQLWVLVRQLWVLVKQLWSLVKRKVPGKGSFWRVKPGEMVNLAPDVLRIFEIVYLVLLCWLIVYSRR
jgi:hypothetical protein